jgi:hypothetical protein
MRSVSSGREFVEPLILKILNSSTDSMPALAINYKVNEAAGRAINLNVIKDCLIFLVKSKKIFESFNEENDVAYYKLIV